MDKIPVSSSVLEERVAMYLQAIEYATAANDGARRQALERDIQTLMDLMERVSVGQVVTADCVPPPLQMHSHAGEPLANPLGELSSRLADYHKALYFADIEIGENRTSQIQTLQRGLQVIQKLQEKAHAGYPIRPEEIPPPVSIPTDDEFVVDPKSVITERIALYYQAIEVAEQEGNKTRVKTLQDGIEKLDYLLKRADINIPVYKKDLPCSPALGQRFRKQTEEYRTTVELLTKMSGLSSRAAKLAAARGDKEKEKQLQHNAKLLTQVLQDYENGKPLDMSACPYSLADIERLADEAGVPASQHIQDTETVRVRFNQYKLAALKAKRSGDTDLALQHMRVVKGLQSLLQAVEKGEPVDMTQVPPPPSGQTPTTEEAAMRLAQTSPETTTREARTEPDSDGMSLAEELSAFLHGAPLPDDNMEIGNGTDSPGKGVPVSRLELLQPATKPQGPEPRTSPVSSSSGLNPLYALTQSMPNMAVPEPRPIGDLNTSAQTPQQSVVSQPPPGPGVIPSHVLKPVSNSEQERIRAVNGFHGSGSLMEPVRTHQFVGEDGRQVGRPEVSGQVGMQVTQSNGTAAPSAETTCIEILKYERMQLEKEGSDDAKMAAERLVQQMEGEKQRLRVGGYEAWLAYLGQVEEDVTNINCEMKMAREGGEDHRLASLIIKKELAERELAVMRKRLPELQT